MANLLVKRQTTNLLFMSNNIHLLELSHYEAPVIKEATREDWVEFGEKNDFYQFLIDRYTNSTTNNAIINNVSRLIYGKGLSATDASRKPSEYAQMKALFRPPFEFFREAFKVFAGLADEHVELLRVERPQIDALGQPIVLGRLLLLLLLLLLGLGLVADH